MKPDSSDPIFLAWAAGFIDGEGCVFIDYRKRGNTLIHNLTLSVSQVERTPLDLLCKAFGGNVTLNKRVLPNRNRSRTHRWFVACKRAEETLNKLLPYLVVKAKEAEIALQCRQTYGSRGHKINPLLITQRFYYKNQLKLYREQRRELSRLNNENSQAT